MNSQLEKLKIELDETVSNPNSNMRDLTKIACSIDQEIEELYISKVSQEEIEKLLNTDQAMVIILDIKYDLLEHYYNISLEELEILAQNIYDYCCLMVNKIPRQEIISYITMKSEKYYYKLSEESRAKMTIEFNIKFFKHLISKYKKIIKSNKKS